MRKCLRCGTQENITKDHVVSRVALRLALGSEDYSRFCAKVRKLNVQDACGPCNNEKGDRSIDLRTDSRPERLREALIDFGLDPEEIFSSYEEVFGGTQQEMNNVNRL
jgi:5-methylcytosine-specific restriction endonuclease McrA